MSAPNKVINSLTGLFLAGAVAGNTVPADATENAFSPNMGRIPVVGDQMDDLMPMPSFISRYVYDAKRPETTELRLARSHAGGDDNFHLAHRYAGTQENLVQKDYIISREGVLTGEMNYSRLRLDTYNIQSSVTGFGNGVASTDKGVFVGKALDGEHCEVTIKPSLVEKFQEAQSLLKSTPNGSELSLRGMRLNHEGRAAWDVPASALTGAWKETVAMPDPGDRHVQRDFRGNPQPCTAALPTSLKPFYSFDR